MTIANIVHAYTDHLRARLTLGDYSPDAFADTLRELTRFSQRFGGQAMADCRQHDLTLWLDSNPQWRSNHTRKRVLGTILRPFLWCVAEGLLERSPYRKPNLRLPTRPRRAATLAEYVALMRCPSRALRRALFFLRRSGCRTCEMRELTWGEIDFQRGVIVIARPKALLLMDDCPPRLVGVEPALRRFLANLHSRRTRGHVFLNAEGEPWATRQVFDRHFRRWCNRLGLPKDLTPYCLRHLWATQAVMAGLTERQVADQLGHANTRLVRWYSKAALNGQYLTQVAAAAVRRQR